MVATTSDQHVPVDNKTQSDKLVLTSLSEQAYAAMRRLIVTGELPPGSNVIDSHLAERLGVSRTPVREAIKRLVQERLLTQLPNRRTVVAEVPLEEVLGLYLIRANVESAAAFLAAQNPHRNENLVDARAAIESASHVPVEAAAQGLGLANTIIHDAIIAASGSELIQETLGAIRTKIVLCRSQALKAPHHTVETLHEHTSIIDAIERGAATEASELLRQHILLAGERALRRAGRPGLASVLRAAHHQLGGKDEG